uniref:Uncharacterized protein n=2 Tax=Solanum tuberosum TaxID=4113 RepID=M1AD71_SOLTU
MGKRKRRADLNKTHSLTDQLPPPGMDALSRQTSHQVDVYATKSFSSIMDIIDDSSKVTQCQQPSIVHRRNIDQAMCSKNPHHYYGLHYTRRRSANNAEASTSRGGTTPLYDELMSAKPASKCNSGSGHDTGATYFLIFFHIHPVQLLSSCTRILVSFGGQVIVLPSNVR